MLRFICGKPAVAFGNSLAIADIHIGMERGLAEKGIRLGSMNSMLLNEIASLLDETKAERLIILGDVKHTIPGVEFSERLALKAMLREVCGMARVAIVPGNHDGDIGEVAPDAEIAPSSGMRIGDVALCHGHAWPDEGIMGAKELLMGHTHPCVEIADELGGKRVERAWLLAKADAGRLREKYAGANPEIRLVLVPAFNPLVGGIPLNRMKDGAPKGPLLRGGMFKFGDGQIHLLNGIGLGRLSALSGSSRVIFDVKRKRKSGKLRVMRKARA